MRKDITNQRFGRLVAVRPSGNKKHNCIAWTCQCDCGNQAEVASNTLRSGYTRSCGCLARETAAKAKLKHGAWGSPAYRSWDMMIQRCTNPKHTSFPRYGALGVTVCERWRTFSLFLSDMGERPAGTSIDRIDSCKGYEPGNCRWATTLEQARNKRKPTTSFEVAEMVRAYRAETGAGPKELAKRFGITVGSASGIIYLGQISRKE